MQIKVLMLGPARTVNGGVSAVVNNYFEAGLDQKVDLTYLGTMEDGSKFRKLRVAIKAILCFILTAWKYDIIHINMASDVSIYRKIPFIWISSLYRKKIIIHQHGGNIQEFYYEQCSDKKRAFIRKSLNKAHHMLVIAPYLKDIFSDIIDGDKITVMPNSIRIPEIGEKNYYGRNILFLGRLCKEKGINELLDAAVMLQTDYPDLRLYLGGYWADSDLQKKAEQCGNMVQYLGWIGREEKDYYLSKCNIFVIPSYFEGQSVSLLEGMAHECACIGSDVGGIPLMLKDRENGLLIPPQNTIALADAIRTYLEDSSLQKQHGKAARKMISDNFDLIQNIQTLVSLYNNLTDNNNQRRQIV